MKITVEHYDNKYTVETHDDLDTYELAEKFAGMALQMGYSRENIIDAFGEMEFIL